MDRSIRIIEPQDIEKCIVSNEPEPTAMNKRIFSRLDALQKVVTETYVVRVEVLADQLAVELKAEASSNPRWAV